MTRDDFHTKLMATRALGPGEYERVFQRIREYLRSSNGPEQFEMLFPFAIKSQSHAPSLPAAELLLELNPQCPLSCEDAIQCLLDEWEISIEEVPFYLAVQFGLTRMRETLKAIGPALEGDRKVRSETIAYWLKKYEEAYENHD